jgi:hypothetical protein
MQVIHIHISTTGAAGKNGADIHIQSIYPNVGQGRTEDPGRTEDLIQNVVKLPDGWLNNLKEEVLDDMAEMMEILGCVSCFSNI